MADFWLDQPRNIVQSSPRDCWAAAMEAWLEIVPGKTAWSQDELFLMAAEKGLVWDKDTLEMNGLVKKGIPVIAKEVGMKLAIFPKYKKKQVTLKYLYTKLSTKGHVYLVYHPPSAPDDLAHAVVCYGISTDDGWIAVMDPWYGQGYQWPSLDEIQDDSNYFIVGYP